MSDAERPVQPAQPAARPALSEQGLALVTGRGLGSLTTLRADGSPHVTPVGFTWDAEQALARVICGGQSRKAAHVVADSRVAVCQVDGRWWLTFEGAARVTADPGEVADAVARYAARYREPAVNPRRVALVVTVTRLLGSPQLRV